MDDFFKERVRERDLDNFLIEELHASLAFRDWFIGHVEGFAEPKGYVVRLRKSPPREQDRRQTDLWIGWFDEQDKMQACLLIESKVTANFQVGQANAYAQEVVSLRERVDGPVASVLVAPAARLSALMHDGAFAAEVSLESIIDFLEARRENDLEPELERRLEARIDLLLALCGKRSSSGWVGRTIAEKRDFAEAYVALAAEIVPQLSVRPSSDGPQAITRIFQGLDLPGLPRPMLRHEFGSGSGMKYANVLFDKSVERLELVRRSALLQQTPYTIEPAGKSLAIRVATPSVDPRKAFAEEEPKVREGLTAIAALVRWLQAHHSSLQQLLGGSSEKAGDAIDKHLGSTAGPTDAAKEKAFREALQNTYNECDKLGYQPKGLKRLMDQYGGIEAARRLLASPPTGGLARLTLMGRLDLAVEALVLQDQWKSLFTDEERRLAESRLK